MSLCNDLIADAARIAAETVDWLDACGCDVIDIQICGPRPTIRIEPPRGPIAQQGVMYKRTAAGGQRRTYYLALHRGARIQWERLQ